MLALCRNRHQRRTQRQIFGSNPDQEIKDGRLLSDQIVKEQRESRKYFRRSSRLSSHTTLTWEAKRGLHCHDYPSLRLSELRN